jgi:hypothetical protein
MADEGIEGRGFCSNPCAADMPMRGGQLTRESEGTSRQKNGRVGSGLVWAPTTHGSTPLASISLLPSRARTSSPTLSKLATRAHNSTRLWQRTCLPSRHSNSTRFHSRHHRARLVRSSHVRNHGRKNNQNPHRHSIARISKPKRKTVSKPR